MHNTSRILKAKKFYTKNYNIYLMCSKVKKIFLTVYIQTSECILCEKNSETFEFPDILFEQS